MLAVVQFFPATCLEKICIENTLALRKKNIYLPNCCTSLEHSAPTATAKITWALQQKALDNGTPPL
ncbi:hypothetical protein XFUD_06925 [Xylella fastidiosa]|uniref:Uncharacterized protein n=1 Tax=Xylella fastidiosa (strain 9a5c) TaxID=160492 RepID=Q9PCX0_XYLFA|nr:hypothetical protein [Xylella fastidiosa]AAF84443.1 hypothetical protein XF_1634 [Xylella fastidiosa 9a5c]ALQ94933.1 hypothetical protein XFUD_06925 [Xylella fastidiosa]WGZ35181.1 hypothetical protein O4445_04690 [Xylella fastidiosa subsp. pauca]